MIRTPPHQCLFSVCALLFASAVIPGCGGGSKAVVSSPAPLSAKCPDFTKAEEVAQFSFKDEYKLGPEAALQLRSGVLAAIEVNAFAESLDADLGGGCAQLARDMGAEGEYRSGAEACTGALRALKDVRSKLGPRTKMALALRPSVCAAPKESLNECAKTCGAKEKAATCAPSIGECKAPCEGACESTSGAKCVGVCRGACEGNASGTCGGKCKGTCSGKPSNGPCAGVCVGKCERGAFEGECKGQCAGVCTAKEPVVCGGRCVGSCKEEMAGCGGELAIKDASVDCRARCAALLLNKLECSDGSASLAIEGAADGRLASQLMLSANKNVTPLVKVATGYGERVSKEVLNLKAVIESVSAGLPDIARSSSGAAAEPLAKCFQPFLDSGAKTAGEVKNDIDLAMSLRDTLSQ